MNDFIEQYEESIKAAQAAKSKIKLLENKIERLEERYVFEEINKAQFEKFKQKLSLEIRAIEQDNIEMPLKLSNLEKSIELGLKYACNIHEAWELGDITIKKAIQNMMFPEGMLYDIKKDCYLTPRVNSIFEVISSISTITIKNKNEINSKKSNLSRLVAGAGLEPATFGL